MEVVLVEEEEKKGMVVVEEGNNDEVMEAEEGVNTTERASHREGKPPRIQKSV